MDLSAVWQTALAIIASVGGAGVIIACIVKWSADRIAEQIIKKKEFEFSQRIEQLKSNLEKKNYISKVRFDLEIDIYRQLSESVLQAVDDCNHLFPLEGFKTDVEPVRDMFKERFDSAVESSDIALKSVMRNAPFIPDEVYFVFLDIINKCKEQLKLFAKFLYDDVSNSICEQLFDEFKSYRIIIQKEQETLICKLREHIASLDVLDR